MNDIEKIIDRYDFNPTKYELKNNARIIDTKNGKYVIKKKKIDNKQEIYNYLYNRNFNYYLPIEKNDSEYEIYRFIEEKNISKADKAIDLIYALSMLHIKTTTYREVLLDDVKKIYEEIISKLKYLNEYYHNIQDYAF